MIDFTDDDYRALCRAGPVALELSTLEDRRRQAVRRFWLFLGAGAVLGAAVFWSLSRPDTIGFAIGLGLIAVVAGGIAGAVALGKPGGAFKQPVLETLARKGALTYLAAGFDPPVYPMARQALFGNWLSGQTFTDLFHGADGEGRRFALYEGTLTRRSGKSTHVVFSGQVYAWQRRAAGGTEIAIVPDRGIFNFFKPVSGMERVRFDSDPDFDRRFEVYAFDSARAMMVVGGDLRRLLLELRENGRVFGWIGPEDALVAVTGRNRFEAGSMFRATSGEDRVRAIFDDVRGSLTALRRLRDALD